MGFAKLGKPNRKKKKIKTNTHRDTHKKNYDRAKKEPGRSEQDGTRANKTKITTMVIPTTVIQYCVNPGQVWGGSPPPVTDASLWSGNSGRQSLPSLGGVRRREHDVREFRHKLELQVRIQPNRT